MADLLGNLLVAQSGGPTAAINASLAGVIIEAGRHPDQIEEIYGALNGLTGVLTENLIDLQEERQHSVDSLKCTPAAALGTCRMPIDFNNPDAAKADLDRLFTVFQTHSIRYFVYIGGHDAQAAALKIHEEAARRGYEMRVGGVPKTIYNDLPQTDSSPGYGSVIKYAAATVLEISSDVRSTAATENPCCVIEVMGQTTGWIPAGTVLAKRNPGDGPHIILLPEVPVDQTGFLKQVAATLEDVKHCVIVTGERLRTSDGQELGGSPGSSVAEHLAGLIRSSLKVKTSTVKLGLAQRSAAHFASTTDADNAFAAGSAAVRAVVEGQSGFMVKIVREVQEDGAVKWGTGIQPLADITATHSFPREWLSEDGFLPSEKYTAYAQPLIEGELRIPTDQGLPKFASLEKVPVDKQLPPYV